MKARLVVGLLSLVLLGCSKQQSQSDASSSVSGKVATPPPETQVVETEVAKDRKAIRGQAWALLNAKDYDGLEALASKYRASKEHYPDGIWKLDYVYAGFELSGGEVEPAWEARQKELQDWIKAKPESVTAPVALAQFWAAYAWHARGDGYASSVREKDFELFGKRLQQSAKILVEAKRQKEKCPVLWLALQKAALGLQLKRTQYDAIFAEAIEMFPNYVFFYRSRAVYLMPRWYGEKGELEKDLQKSADRLGGEAGDKLYARVVWSIHNYGGSENIFRDNDLSWERTERGFNAILKEFPDSIPAISEAAHLAGLGKSPETARQYLLKTKGQVDLDCWQGTEQYLSLWEWAFGQ